MSSSSSSCSPLPRLALRLLPRLALVERGYRQLPTDQKGLSRSILDAFAHVQWYASYPWQLQAEGSFEPKRRQAIPRRNIGTLCCDVCPIEVRGERLNPSAYCSCSPVGADTRSSAASTACIVLDRVAGATGVPESASRNLGGVAHVSHPERRYVAE